MSQTVADYILHRLHAWGIRRIYGYPGDGINGFMGAMDRATGKNGIGLEYIQTRHEEMAAFMACAHAKFTGEIGVCMATSGPGAVHLLNGLYDAKMDHQPVLAIVGQQATAALGGDYQQEIDLISLFKDVAHEYVHLCSAPVQARHQIDRAVRIARGTRSVTCVIVPNDIQEEDAVEQAPHAHATIHSSVGYSLPRVIPAESDLARAAEVLNSGEKVAMLVGAGAAHAADVIKETAEMLGAGCAKALLGKTTLPDDISWVTGAIGLLGTRSSWEMMANCDTLLMIGSSFPYPEFLPQEGQARAVQIDIDPRMLGIRYPMEVNLHGDSTETLRALMPLLKHKSDRSWREFIENSTRNAREEIAAKAQESAKPINPQYVFEELSPRLPDRCILTSDSGSAANWYARNIQVREGMMGSLSGNLATMGPGVPYAISAKFAFPDRAVIALVGDGAMQMNGLNGLITAARYWQEWKDPRLVVLVLNNEDLNQVTWEQRVMSGDPKYQESQVLPSMNYAEYARSLGLEGLRMERKEDVRSVWDRALKADRPVVVDALTDPEVPPLPPHITMEQAKGFLSSVIRDPERSGMIKQAFKAMKAQLTSGSKS